MPAEAWAVQFPVGKGSNPGRDFIRRKALTLGAPERSSDRELSTDSNREQNTSRNRGPSPSSNLEHSNLEAGNSSGTRHAVTRDHMLSQVPRRIDDTMLVREAQRGNRAAFEELVRHYDQAVLRLALHLTGSEHEAQDIYQDAFLKAYKSIGRFRFECSFYTWIYRIVVD